MNKIEKLKEEIKELKESLHYVKTHSQVISNIVTVDLEPKIHELKEIIKVMINAIELVASSSSPLHFSNIEKLYITEEEWKKIKEKLK